MASASGGQQAAALNAVVIGGTGATGSHLVGTLLKAKDVVGKVTVFGWWKLKSVPEQYGVDLSTEESEGRLVQHVEELQDVSDETVKQLCTGGHVFFNGLGTAETPTGAPDVFRQIDFEIPTRFARLAREAGVVHCSILASAGFNSWILLLQVKGELEQAAREMGFSYVSIFQPGPLDRSVGGLKYYLGKLLGYIHVATVAEAMAQDAYAYHGRRQQSAPEGATPTSPEVTIASDNRIRQISKGSTHKAPDQQPINK